VIVHRAFYPDDQWRELGAALEAKRDTVRLDRRFGDDFLYRIAF